MAPNLTDMMLSNSADPVQIISKPVEYRVRPVDPPKPKIIYNKPSQPQYEWQIVWRNVIAFIYLHSFAIYGLYLLFAACKTKTIYWVLAVLFLAGQGITSGAHRLWAHRAYKARLPLRIFLCFLQTMAFQNHLYEWVRDHRVHHKFTDSDADPHNAKRGFFFSHMGWLMLKKHKDVSTKGKTVDLSDLEADPVVMFQKKYYLILMPIACFVIPAAVPWYFWGETWWNSWHTAGILRYTVSLNGTWLVNSAAHIWGMKPYDKNIKPTENYFVAFMAFGEGWHNYHHVFPWDYKAAELGNYRLNWSTCFIDLMAKIGWAYDLKTASLDIIKKRIRRTGDGTIKVNEDIDTHGHEHEDIIWGWGDKDMTEEDKEDVRVFNKLNNK
ncbi:unnamed protein product [Brassicogethes aeneus]|uniref:Fatty acid desaturase domain-containing protein n=1 Tax=Brassicogethes aeneus TaxID=1431903 RepID=A0A9P0BBS0_BRAAE|nr:unnamed protein product [Brassicogethes aeneus]